MNNECNAKAIFGIHEAPCSKCLHNACPNHERVEGCSTWEWAFDEYHEKCPECRHYHCPAFRKMKDDQERYEEDYL